MKSRYEFLKQAGERRRFALFRSSVAASVVAAVFALAAVAPTAHRPAAASAEGELTALLGGSEAAAVAPVQTQAAAAPSLHGLAEADSPEAARATLYMGEPGVF
ncbi:MAG: hypothetical protein ACK6C0_06985 [Betaproteobacteria bacterium]